MPDIFMPLDTTYNTKLLTDLIRKNVFNSYCIDYVLANRDKLNKDYPEFEKYNKKFDITDAMIADFRRLAESKDVVWDDEQYQRSESWIKLRLKGMIAQDMWNLDKYYQVVLAEDKMILRAVEVINSKREYNQILGK